MGLNQWDLEEQKASATIFRMKKVWKPRVFVSLRTFSWRFIATAHPQQWHIRHQASVRALPWTGRYRNHTILYMGKRLPLNHHKNKTYTALLKVGMGLRDSYHCIKWRIHRDLNRQQLSRLCSSLCLNKSGCSLNTTSFIVPYSSSTEFCPLTAYRRCTNTKEPQVIYFDKSCCNKSQVLITPLSHTISSRTHCFQSSKMQPALLQSYLSEIENASYPSLEKWLF